ncbi:SH2 domain-containing protein 1B [Anolis carolinensis]|uniref:SH2 domain-containing protein 1B n=1 Tax=Anolis carolinensis TaxID=28377 RepID=UPI0002038FDE|nr:PREDICTED: SH2 domain-containing protein 1B [Anolis carolinensis]|eukprot:XP_016848044.1 PREDICTED: SH2 domain-containing protein 1B [Anolis carolinensis]
MELQYYHGNITKENCEALLSKNKNNGCFLIRDSESIPGALCLCVFYESFVYTYRIFRKHNGHFMIQASEGAPKQDFKTLKDLIATFEKPNQGLIINLRYPVNRSTSCQHPHNAYEYDDDYVNNEPGEDDYVQVLPD